MARRKRAEPEADHGPAELAAANAAKRTKKAQHDTVHTEVKPAKKGATKAANGTAAPAQPPSRGKAKAAATQQAADAAPSTSAEADGPAYYLIKSEPHEFSIDDLEKKPNSTGEWDGVRNFQARNIMMGMNLGDQAFFYHSNTKLPGIVGLVKVVRQHYPDHTAFDKNHKGYDPKSSADAPKWEMVDVQLVRHTSRLIGLQELKEHKDGALKGMQLFTMPRLSVQRVAREHWDFILSLEQQDKDAAAADKS